MVSEKPRMPKFSEPQIVAMLFTCCSPISSHRWIPCWSPGLGLECLEVWFYQTAQRFRKLDQTGPKRTKVYQLWSASWGILVLAKFFLPRKRSRSYWVSQKNGKVIMTIPCCSLFGFTFFVFGMFKYRSFDLLCGRIKNNNHFQGKLRWKHC